MVFFRGKRLDASIWRRFRTGADGFTFIKEGDYYAAHAVANAERVVDLFHVLTANLPPAVDVAITDERSKRSWKGENLPLPDVRDALARLKVPLAAAGGVEISVYTTDDQLTLNEHLELFIYSRTDAWLYMLKGKGLEEQRAVRTRSWKSARGSFAPSPELDEAIRGTVDRLALSAAA